MREWLVEEGIGEHRALLMENGEVVAARIDWPGRLAPGQVEDAVLISRTRASGRGTARFASGEEALVDRLPSDAQEGAPLRLIVTRTAIGEAGRTKLAQARPTEQAPCPVPSLLQSLQAGDEPARAIRRFEISDWEDIWGDAWSCRVSFPGGELQFTPTPAMLLIDVDGALPARELAMAAVPEIARSVRRFDLAGSIGIDFPTLSEKAERRRVDDALARALSDWPHESTAMNGFGFVQLVSRLERPSLLHRIAQGRVGAAARLLLRQAERIDEPGALVLTCHPAVKARLRPEWLEELARRSGREVRTASDPTLALEAGFAQAVPA